MKYLTTLLFALLPVLLQAQRTQPVKKLQESYDSLSHHYFFEAPQLTPWAEGRNMLLAGDQPDIRDCRILFIALHDTTLVGVFKATPPVSFLTDRKGNGVLAAPTNVFLLPVWTIKTKTDPGDKTVLHLFDKMYETMLQANDGLGDEKTISQYEQLRTDTTIANRRLALMFDNYQQYVPMAGNSTSAADLQLQLIGAVADECKRLYGTLPPIVCIYMGEALLSAGMKDEARAHFKAVQEIYPTSIPIAVYNCRLEQDKDKRQLLRDSLKKRFPKHWMVKDL